jgi:hypothetical protein
VSTEPSSQSASESWQQALVREVAATPGTDTEPAISRVVVDAVRRVLQPQPRQENIMDRVIPSPAVQMREAADYVESHPIDFDSLANGPLGEALTRGEIEGLADNQAAVSALVAQLRETNDAA